MITCRLAQTSKEAQQAVREPSAHKQQAQELKRLAGVDTDGPTRLATAGGRPSHSNLDDRPKHDKELG